MRFENTGKDLYMIYGKAEGPTPFPGTGFTKSGAHRVGYLDVPDADLPALMGDLSKLIHAGIVKVAAEDRVVLEGAGLLHAKQG